MSESDPIMSEEVFKDRCIAAVRKARTARDGIGMVDMVGYQQFLRISYRKIMDDVAVKEGVIPFVLRGRVMETNVAVSARSPDPG